MTTRKFLLSVLIFIVIYLCEYPLTGKDYPGFRFYTEVEKLENWNEDNISKVLMSLTKDVDEMCMYQLVLAHVRECNI